MVVRHGCVGGFCDLAVRVWLILQSLITRRGMGGDTRTYNAFARAQDQSHDPIAA